MKNRFLLLLLAAPYYLLAQISFTNQTFYLTDPTAKSGAPIAIADMNGDTLDDIVRLRDRRHIQIQYQPPTPNTTFTSQDVITLNGTSWGVCIADVDGDGYNDIFTGGSYNGLKLLKAQNNGTSYDLTTLTAPPTFLQTANFADIDNDGHIDIFACHDDGLSVPFRNDGSGNFSADYPLINTASTVPSDNSGNYGSVWIDYDNDGDLDMYLSKCRLGVNNPLDGRRLNLLFQNDGNGNYTDVAEAAGVLPMGQSWASDFADIDNDGDLDLFVINHDIESVLYENMGDGTFQNITPLSGVTPDLVTAGAGIQVIFEDFDNDGYEDLLFTSTGSNHCLFKNNGDQTFTKVQDAFPVIGGQRIHSAAVGDLNNDGFMDVYAGFGVGYNGTNSGNLPDQMFINSGNDNNHVKVSLKGIASNPNGIGARVELYGSFGQQIRDIKSGESYGIMNAMTAHFGIGTATAVDKIVVRWPSGAVDEVLDPAINQHYVIEEGQFCAPVVDFTETGDGLGVAFEDQSSAGVTEWRWDFGDGDTSIVQNPFHIYEQPGDYTVCLEATDDCGTGETCKVITVGCNPPITNFMITITGSTIVCEDDSDNYPSSWFWSFGDGGASMEQNPTYTYTEPGNYQVCLDAQNACGSTILCATVPIGCVLPQAAFGFQTSELVVNFEDASSDNVESWAWDFGDGNVSMEPSPQHTYDAAGTYLVCLTVENDCGTDVSCFPVMVSCTPPSVGYAWTISNLDVAFVATNMDVDSYAWDFGDGVGTSTLANPLYTYAAPGAYEVCLTVTDECGTSELCQTIQVQCPAPQAAFNFVTNQLDVSFSDNSNVLADTWLWDFGDGNTSTAQNPQYSYAAPGTYQVCLTITGTCGTDEVCTIVTVNCPPPTPIFGYITNELSVDFVDFSAGDPAIWSWNFGDGQFSNEQSPDHTYSQPGTYTVCLTVSGTCGAQQVCQDVTVACTPPAVGFMGTNDGSLTWVFTNLSSADASSFLWDFGDGNTSVEVDPTYTYAEAGSYTICLTAISICGSTQVCETVNVQCLAPNSAFGFQTSGLAVNFTDNSANGPATWLWDFGDGNTSMEQNPQYNYAAPGTYTVCLTTTNTCGEDAQCFTITVDCAPPSAGYAIQVDGLDIDLTDLSANNPETWVWTFGDGTTSTEQNPDHSYAAPGTYEVCLTVSSVCGSTTLCENIQVSCAPPVAGFSTNSDIALTVQFDDNSTGGVTSWLWDFGDGNTATTENPTHSYATSGTYQVCLTASSVCGSTTTCTEVIVSCPAPEASFIFGADELTISTINTSSGVLELFTWTFGDGATSSAQSPSHTYDIPGTYEVCLTTTSICGTDQFCQMITVSCPAPLAAFTSNAVDLGVQFADNSTDGVSSWLWDFGDGTTSGEMAPFHLYSTPGTYTVCLTVNGICGQDQICSEVVVSCAAPEADFAFVPNGLTVEFIDASTNSSTGWLWNFGDGTISTEANPNHTYETPGTYQVCLAVNSVCGSTESCFMVEVNCAAPEAAFEVTSAQLEHTFTDLSTQMPTSWLWDFGDGATSNQQNPQHTYAAPGNYTVCLTSESICGSDQTCTDIQVTCSAPQADFEVIADELTLTFNDLSMNNPTIWLWNFGDGTTSNVSMPTHTYNGPGNYLVCLEVESVCGSTQRCEVIMVSCTPAQADFDFVTNDLSVQFSNLTPGTPDQLVWDFGDGATAFAENPMHEYDAPGSYEVCLQTVELCGTSTYCQTVEVSCVGPTAAFGVVVDGGMVTCTDFSNPVPTSWLWDFGDGNTSIEANPQHTYEGSGTFNICFTATTICGSSTACQEVMIVIDNVEELANATPELQVFPNPVKERLQVKILEMADQEAQLVLHAATGQVIEQKVIPIVQGEAQISWDVQTLPAGIYWLVLTDTSGEQLTQRFVKQ